MLNYHHEPTGTTVVTDTGPISTGTSFDDIKIQTGVVGINVAAYEANEHHPAFESHHVHIYTNGVPDPDSITAAVRNDSGDGYIVVQTEKHTNVYMPIEMAEAIVKGLADHKFAEDEKICSEVK